MNTDYYMIAAIILLVVIIVIILIAQYIMQQQDQEIKELKAKIESDNDNIADIDTIEYSQKLIDFIKSLTIEIAILKYKEYIDSHEFEKLQKTHIAQIAEDTAKSVHDAINFDIIDFDDVLYTKEFYESFIIKTSLASVKSLLEKSLDVNNNEK